MIETSFQQSLEDALVSLLITSVFGISWLFIRKVTGYSLGAGEMEWQFRRLYRSLPGWLQGNDLSAHLHQRAPPLVVPHRQQTAQPVPEKSFRFLCLPIEIQLMILIHTLGYWEAHGLYQFRFENGKGVGKAHYPVRHRSSPEHYVIFGFPKPTAMSLLLTNKHISNLALEALGKTFTGHLSIISPRGGGSQALRDWLRIHPYHQLAWTYSWLFERVTVIRTDCLEVAVAWSRTSKGGRELRTVQPQSLLPNLKRIEYDLTQTMPAHIAWAQDDLRNFRNGEYDDQLIQARDNLYGVYDLLTDEHWILERGIQVVVTVRYAVTRRGISCRSALAQVELLPRKGVVLRRVIETGDGSVEWENQAEEITEQPSPRPGEIDARWHSYGVWARKKDRCTSHGISQVGFGLQ